MERTRITLSVLIEAMSDRDPREWADALAFQLQADLRAEMPDSERVEVVALDWEHVE